MRSLSLSLLVLSCVALGGCGSSAPDMAELPPPGAGPDHGHHRPRHGSGVSYADDAPVMMAMPPGAEGGGATSDGGGRRASPGSVTFGSGDGGGNSADVTPQAAVPDTEVTYGQNNQKN